MNTNQSAIKFLGAAFLLQAVASVGWTLLLLQLMVPGDIVASMANIADNALQMRVSILLTMVTAIGVAMLGALLFVVLKVQHAKVAFVAMCFYQIEAAILAASRMPAYSLLRVSQESVEAGHPEYLQALAKLLYEAADFGDLLHMLPFAIGAVLFYSLFFQSRMIPRVLSIWGLVAAFAALMGTPLILLGINVPLVVFMPNFPFEVTVGIWLLVKGVSEQDGITTRIFGEDS